MTALTQYERLETTGVWHEGPNAQRRDVGVILGEASLVIKDSTDMALTHWSLAAVERIGQTGDTVTFAPGRESDERLELTDATMIEALIRVRRAMDRSQPKRWRVRRWTSLAMLVAVAVLSITWLPGALVSHTASALPEATRQDLGRRMVGALEPHMGRPCRNPEGQRAADQLRVALFGAAPWVIQVVEAGGQTLALPGGVLVMGGEVLDRAAGADEVAADLLIAAERSRQTPPTAWLLNQAGVSATFGVLTTGDVTDAVLGDVAQALVLGRDLPPLDLDALRDRFTQSGLSTASAAATMGLPADQLAQLQSTPTLADGDTPLLLSDADWLRLQSICDDP